MPSSSLFSVVIYGFAVSPPASGKDHEGREWSGPLTTGSLSLLR
jgi:hypothetical protein